MLKHLRAIRRRLDDRRRYQRLLATLERINASEADGLDPDELREGQRQVFGGRR